MGARQDYIDQRADHSLGRKEETSSPTFAIINEYHTAEGRASLPLRCLPLGESRRPPQYQGTTDYLYISGCYCFVEWPALLPFLLPDEVVRLRIEVEGDQRRLTLLDSEEPFIYDPE